MLPSYMGVNSKQFASEKTFKKSKHCEADDAILNVASSTNE